MVCFTEVEDDKNISHENINSHWKPARTGKEAMCYRYNSGCDCRKEDCLIKIITFNELILSSSSPPLFLIITLLHPQHPPHTRCWTLLCKYISVLWYDARERDSANFKCHLHCFCPRDLSILSYRKG